MYNINQHRINIGIFDLMKKTKIKTGGRKLGGKTRANIPKGRLMNSLKNIFKIGLLIVIAALKGEQINKVVNKIEKGNERWTGVNSCQIKGWNETWMEHENWSSPSTCQKNGRTVGWMVLEDWETETICQENGQSKYVFNGKINSPSKIG